MNSPYCLSMFHPKAMEIRFYADAGKIAERLDLKSLTGVVRNCRNISKSDMVLNDYLPEISVDPQTYQVFADGELLTCDPAVELPLTQRYFLF